MGLYLSYILLGIIQGFTEFLPVSSSGHLILIEQVMRFNPPGVVTEVALHLATLLAVLIYYRRDVAALLSGKSYSGMRIPKSYMGFVILATAVTALCIFPFRDAIESLTEGRPALIALVFTFSFTALLMFLADWLLRRPRARASEATSLGWPSVIFIAVVQAIAALPGVSRSGSTITAGIAAGLKRDEAARFSFMLFIPISLLAVGWEVYRLLKGGEAISSSLYGPMAVGFVFAFLCGYAAIRMLLAVLEKARLSWFGIYLVAVAIFTAVWARI